MSRRRQLSEEERALWRGVARSIKPLRQSTGSAVPQAAERSIAPEIAPARPHPAAHSELPRLAKQAPPPLVPLGRRLRQRVARGHDTIDARIDLHGKTQREAHAALLRFLKRAQADGARIALVVTGKGTMKGRDEHRGASERGVLKRQVPLWLALPEFRPLVVGFEDAHIGHGGQGALYVRLRRER